MSELEPVKQAAGRVPWTDLFEIFHMEHVCSAVKVNIVNSAQGFRTDFHEPLRAYLLTPLDDYLKANWPPGEVRCPPEMKAALALQELADKLAELFEEGHPFSEESAGEYRASLRSAWVEFMAQGAAHRISHDLPRDQAQRRNAAKLPRGRAADLTPAEVARRIQAAGTTELSQELAAEIADAFKVADSTVYRRLKKARAMGLLS